MQKTKFTYSDNEYRIIAQSRRSLVAVRNLDTCCLETYFQINHATTNTIKGEKDSVLALLCSKMATLAMDEAESAEKDSSFGPITIALPDGKKYDPMKPTEVPGTSGGSVYKVLLTTHHGLISYLHGNIQNSMPNSKPPRIRVVKNDQGKAWISTKINDAGNNFSTVESTHMSHTGSKVEDTAALIMRGLNALLSFGFDF